MGNERKCRHAKADTFVPPFPFFTVAVLLRLLGHARTQAGAQEVVQEGWFQGQVLGTLGHEEGRPALPPPPPRPRPSRIGGAIRPQGRDLSRFVK